MYFIYKSTPLPSLVLFFFFLIPFYPNIVQLRNFLAFAVFFVALKFWDNKKILSLLYVFCVLTHYSFLVLLPFFIIRKFEFFKRTKINNLIILFGVVLVMLLPKEYGDMFILGVNDKYSVYSENSKGFLGTVLLFLPFFMINSFVIWHYNKNGVSQNVLIPLVYNKQIPLIVELIQYSNYLIIAQYFIRDFSRFNMNILVLNFIYLTIVFYYVILPKKGVFQVIEYNVLLFLYVVFIFIITFFLLNNGSYFEIIEKTITSNINF
ncbi:hypothetical protein AX766_09435 [Flavobacterium covae]|nr:hypothetical protein AX766_09435 [Flavobacterium covae]